MSKVPASLVGDIAAQSADLNNYSFLGDGAGRTVVGMLVDQYGTQYGDLFTYSVPQAGSGTPVYISTMSGVSDLASHPEVVGAILRFDGAALAALRVGNTSDFEANYAYTPLQIAGNEIVKIGHISPQTFPLLEAVFTGASITIGAVDATIVGTTLPTTGASSQVTIAVTNTAQQLPSQVYLSGPVLKASKANTGTVYVDFSDAIDDTTGYPLENSGEGIGYSLSNSNALWIYGTAGDVLFLTGT